MNTRAFRADILLLMTAAIWGFGFVAQSSGMDYVGPFTFNAIRFPLGSLSLLPLIFFFRRKKLRRELEEDSKVEDGFFQEQKKSSPLLLTLIAGTVLFIAVTLQQIGIIFTSVGNAGFITGFYVVLTPVFAMLIGKKTGIPTWIGMVAALTGLYFISTAGKLSSLNPGDIITIISAVFWAVHILVIDNMVRKIDPLILSAGQFAWCGLFCLVCALAAEPYVGAWAAKIAPDFAIQQWKTMSDLLRGGAGAALGSAAVPLLYGGIASVGVAYTLQVVAQKDAPPAHATIILCLEGAFAAAGGILLRGERPTAHTLIGFALMLCAMIITQWDVIRAHSQNEASAS